MSFKAMECPNCLKVFSQEIRVCSTGHSICISCCKKITACCICKQPITGMRNYMLENEVAKMQSSNCTALFPGFKNCTLCRKAPDSEMMTHLAMHSKPHILCEKYFFYTKVFNKPGDEVENDILIVSWNDIIFNFYIQVQHKVGNVCFAMQLGEERANKRYVFEVDTRCVARKHTFVGSVLEEPLDCDNFPEGCIIIPKQEFLKGTSNVVAVHVYCDIREDEGVSSDAKPRQSMRTKSKK